MKRTPRSASRRAMRQFEAKVPGLFTSLPYISKVFSSSLLKSVSSGTDICIRKAISLCAMRVRTSGSRLRSYSFSLSSPTKSSMRRRSSRETPSGFFKYKTGSLPERNLHPWCSLDKNPEPQKRADSACMLPNPWVTTYLTIYWWIPVRKFTAYRSNPRSLKSRANPANTDLP